MFYRKKVDVFAVKKNYGFMTGTENNNNIFVSSADKYHLDILNFFLLK